MVDVNENKVSNSQYKGSILEIILKDADESLKLLHSDSNSINTRLAFLIGFNATFASFLSKLPYSKIEVLEKVDSYYSYKKQLLSILAIVIGWFLQIKPVIALLICFSVTLAIYAIILLLFQ